MRRADDVLVSRALDGVSLRERLRCIALDAMLDARGTKH